MPERRRKKENNFMIHGVILSIAAVITKIIGAIYRIPLTNILGDEGNGFYSYAFDVYAIALLLSSFSLPLAVSKLMSARIARGQRRNAFRVFICALFFSIVIGLAVSLLIFFGADFIAANIMKAPMSAFALKVLAPALFIVSVMGVIRGYFQGLGNMIPTAISQVLEQIFNAIISIVGAYSLFKFGESVAKGKNAEQTAAAYGAAGGTLGTVLGALFALLFLLFLFYMNRHNIHRRLRADRSARIESRSRIIRILLITMIPVVMSTGIYNINSIIDKTVFNNVMASQGYTVLEYTALMGIYSGKYSVLINIPLAIANALGASVIPSLTAAVTAGNKTLTHSKINLSVRFGMIVAIPCCVGFMVLASPIMQLLFNDARTSTAMMLILGAVTVVFYSLSTITNAILQGINQMNAPVKNGLISLVIHLIALFIMLVPLKWNIYGVVISNIIFSLCMCILNARDIAKASGYKQEKDKTFFKPVTASVIMGVATYACYLIFDIFIGGKIATLIAIVVAVLVYAISLLKLGGLSEDELRSMPKGDLIVHICKKFHLISKEIF
ncbi:MAG: polysaccharide biosynthesis protein [Hespellia sp.]|nr:polysaccharide biosynthesis protein [Hespellia sp.]